MDLETALTDKWESGKQHHRHGEKTFQGDACEELFQELLDCIHYVNVLEGQGVELPGYKTTFRNMALALQQRQNELRRRL